MDHASLSASIPFFVADDDHARTRKREVMCGQGYIYMFEAWQGEQGYHRPSLHQWEDFHSIQMVNTNIFQEEYGWSQTFTK
jgi:hypothetical protein